MSDTNYVLAMYDVRGKQSYIFRGRKLKEIVGGSLVISDIFKDELFPSAKIYKYKDKLKNVKEEEWDEKLAKEMPAIFSYRDNNNVDFSREDFTKHIQNGYLGEVIYEGGGNFFILYKDRTTFQEINKIFTKRVLKNTYSLTVLASCIEGVNFDNYTTLFADEVDEETVNQYKGDREKLYSENRRREAIINPQMPAQVLPFSQVDYANSLPLYDVLNEKIGKLTKEAYRKYQKFEEYQTQFEMKKSENDEYHEKILDLIAAEKGTDSWIAVIYIDGNNMGAKVQGIFEEEKKKSDQNIVPIPYEIAIRKLRSFSESIQKNYIDDRKRAIDERLKIGKDDEYKRRLVVYAGDEINIIVNAHDAFDAIKAYFKDMPKTGSACAGIAIFKSHMPYADAYHIAEQCCENAKQLMKKYNMQEANLVDFHYCQGVIGSDIEKIRERECGDIISKPWFITNDATTFGDIPKEDIVTIDMVCELVDKLNTCTRTNIKGLLECAKNSEAELFTELTRMQLRRKNQDNATDMTDIKDVTGKKMSREKLRKLIYDVVSVYDLWFGGK